jgi:hypothetical protein
MAAGGTSIPARQATAALCSCALIRLVNIIYKKEINVVALIVGIILVVGTIASVVCSIGKTPDNLRGYYGGFYAIISLFGFLGGIGLIILSLMI